MFGINMWELVLLIALASVLIGPERMPEYVRKLRIWIRQMRDYAEGAKTQLKDEMGPEFTDVNWRQYDPRQYDPRKIVRDALFDGDDPRDMFRLDGGSSDDDGQMDIDPVMDAGHPTWEPMRYDPDRVTPYDTEAT